MSEPSPHRAAELDVIEVAEEMVLLLDQHQMLRRGTKEQQRASSANLDACRKKMKAAVARMYVADVG